MAPRLELRPYGDSGLLAGVLTGLQGDDYESRWSTTQALAAALRDAHPAWLVDLVATYDHLFVTFDPGRSDHPGVETLLQELSDSLDADAIDGLEHDGRTFRVPVLFGGDAGPDLEDVAAELDLTADALVERLTAAPWRVRFVASPVGTPFTDRDDWNAAIPRVREPRVAVPPGSIALSGSQSIIYPVPSPGGWRLVGRTPLRLVDLTAEPEELVAYRAGDQLAYVPIDADRFAELEEQGEQLGSEW
jgi:KipI family sensor histidine kinase inhibitor